MKQGQYVKATELLAQILPRYRATEEAEELNWMNAQSLLWDERLSHGRKLL